MHMNNDGLECLVKIGAEADQNYQNYILRGEMNFCQVLADCTACSMISYWHDNVHLSMSVTLCIVAK